MRRALKEQKRRRRAGLEERLARARRHVLHLLADAVVALEQLQLHAKRRVGLLALRPARRGRVLRLLHVVDRCVDDELGPLVRRPRKTRLSSKSRRRSAVQAELRPHLGPERFEVKASETLSYNNLSGLVLG